MMPIAAAARCLSSRAWRAISASRISLASSRFLASWMPVLIHCVHSRSVPANASSADARTSAPVACRHKAMTKFRSASTSRSSPATMPSAAAARTLSSMVASGTAAWLAWAVCPTEVAAWAGTPAKPAISATAVAVTTARESTLVLFLIFPSFCSSELVEAQRVALDDQPGQLPIEAYGETGRTGHDLFHGDGLGKSEIDVVLIRENTERRALSDHLPLGDEVRVEVPRRAGDP